jgi:hypothetical protein
MARIRRDVKSDRLERIAVNSGATLRDPSGQPDDVVVCDLSGTGFRLSGERTLSSDGDVTLGIGGIVRTARIVRETDTGYGFAFAQPLSDAQLREALTRADVCVVRLTFPTAAPRAPSSVSEFDTPHYSAPARLFILIAACLLSWGIVLTALHLVLRTD